MSTFTSALLFDESLLNTYYHKYMTSEAENNGSARILNLQLTSVGSAMQHSVK